VNCDLSGKCGLCLQYSYASGKWPVCLAIARNWQLIGGTLNLDKSGGNDVVIINGFVSELNGSLYKMCHLAAVVDVVLLEYSLCIM